MIINLRKRRDQHAPLYISGTQVERVKTFKLLSTHISKDLTWTHNTQQIIKKAQQRLFFPGKLRKFGLSSKLLSNFYRRTVESILKNSITVWYGNCSTKNRKALQCTIKTAKFICGAAFPPLQDIYKRAQNIIKDHTHPQHRPSTPVVWQTLHECESKDNQTKEQFLSTGHLATESLTDSIGTF